MLIQKRQIMPVFYFLEFFLFVFDDGVSLLFLLAVPGCYFFLIPIQLIIDLCLYFRDPAIQRIAFLSLL